LQIEADLLNTKFKYFFNFKNRISFSGSVCSGSSILQAVDSHRVRGGLQERCSSFQAASVSFRKIKCQNFSSERQESFLLLTIFDSKIVFVMSEKNAFSDNPIQKQKNEFFEIM